MARQNALLRGAGERLWALVSLAIGASVPWALWSAARTSESFLGGAALAAPLSLLALAALDSGFGVRVGLLVRALLSLSSGQVSRAVTARFRGGAPIDVGAALALFGLAAALFVSGFAAARPSTVLAALGAAVLGLAFVASALVARSIRRLPRVDAIDSGAGADVKGVSEQQKDALANSIALFVSAVIVALSISAGVAGTPSSHFYGRPLPLFRGEWADGCVGPKAPCEPAKILTLDGARGPVLIEAVLSPGMGFATRAATPGRVPLSRVAGTESTYSAELVSPAAGALELSVTGQGAFQVRWRRPR